jgi:ribosomal protein L22
MVDEKKMETKKVDEKKMETKVSPRDDSGKPEGKMDVKEEKKVETKKEEKKVVAKKVEKKESAIANGISLKISPKQSKAICKMIKGKTPERAVEMLEEVVKGKRPVHMAGLEVAHQKGKGVAGAKFPKNAATAIIDVVKQVGANAIVNGVDEPVITIAKSNRAAAPLRRGGRRAKRTHVYLEVRTKVERKAKAKNKGAKK